MTSELLLVLPGFLMLGAFVGFCAGFLGIGGGLILVPGLYYLLKYVGLEGQSEDVFMHTALATSMAIILPTAISSSWAQIKRKAVDWASIRLMVPGLVIGVVIGLSVISGMDSQILKIIFSIGLTGIAASMIMKGENAKNYPVLQTYPCALPFSIVFGVAATFLGIGGAVLNVPYLNRAGVPLKTAIATGSVLGVVIAFIATIGYLVKSHDGHSEINALAFMMIVPASVLVAPFGVKMSHRVPVAKLKIIFATLLMILAIKMFIEAL